MELPSDPEPEDAVPHREPAASGSRAFVIVGVLFAVIVILHLTGVVGPAAQ